MYYKGALQKMTDEELEQVLASGGLFSRSAYRLVVKPALRQLGLSHDPDSVEKDEEGKWISSRFISDKLVATVEYGIVDHQRGTDGKDVKATKVTMSLAA